jgi:serine protease Do
MKSIAALFLLLIFLTGQAWAQDEEDYPALPRPRYRSGQQVLDAFKPISAQTRNSVVEVNVSEDTVALGAVVDDRGLVLTKASEIKKGKLTCWLANGKEAGADLLAFDDEDDVALLRVKAKGLTPVHWAANPVVEGQWAVTQGLADTPQAVGIISALTHKMRPQRAFIGVQWVRFASRPIVDRLEPGYGAEEAGVKRGDIIVAVDGTSVTNIEQVVKILQDFRDGQSVHMRFQREKSEYEATIRLTTPKPGQPLYDIIHGEHEDDMSGDVSLRSEGFEEAIETDTVLEPWQCGGPLLDLNGQAIGLNIARANRVTTYALPAPLVHRILTRLLAKIDHPSSDDR